MTPDEIERLVNEGRIEEALSSPKAPVEEPSIKPVIEQPTFVPREPLHVTPEGIVANATNPRPPIEPQRDEGFDIQDPFELLMLLDDQIASGRVTLHKWQIQFMTDFARGGVSDEAPFQALVRACNGSGKDKYVIAPCVVWLCMKFIKARGVVTSSSGKQLDSQTCTYIDLLCNEANRKIAPGIWKLNYRYYECLATGSPIECFATDEAGKAEGFHPLEYGRKMGLFMSEAKTVPDEVNVAFNKCTGYTHRAHVSTPGLPLGHFFEYCQRSPYRRDVTDLSKVNPIDYIQYHVTAYECSHLSRVYIEQMKRDLPGGEMGAAFQSQVMAEFGTTDEMVVIPHTYVWRAINNPPKIGHLTEKLPTGGLDLSAGGDETAFAVRNGNKLLKIMGFKFDNTQATITYLEKQFKMHGFDNPHAKIFADAGGLGKPIIDQLRERGWTNIRYVLNQAKPYDERVYVNRGAEMWFNFGKLLEGYEIWLCDDDKLKTQLTSRYYKITDKNKHQLESKMMARSKGHPSPDRADAVVLAFSNYRSKLDEEKYEKPYTPEEPLKPVRQFTLREWADVNENGKETALHPSKGRDFRLYRDEITAYNNQIKGL